jgi:hypothetical protein
MTYGNTASGFEAIEDFGELFGEAAEDGGLESAEADWEGLLGSRRRRRRIRQQLDGATEAAETFATSGSAAISTLELRSAVAASTETEFRRWNTAAHILEEGHDWGKHILKDDYWPAVGVANATTHFGGSW